MLKVLLTRVTSYLYMEMKDSFSAGQKNDYWTHEVVDINFTRRIVYITIVLWD